MSTAERGNVANMTRGPEFDDSSPPFVSVSKVGEVTGVYEGEPPTGKGIGQGDGTDSV